MKDSCWWCGRHETEVAYLVGSGTVRCFGKFHPTLPDDVGMCVHVEAQICDRCITTAQELIAHANVEAAKQKRSRCNGPAQTQGANPYATDTE